MAEASLLERYLTLGLGVGRHIDGFVDAYYGPPALAERVAAEPVPAPAALLAEARAALAGLDGGEPIGGLSRWGAGTDGDPGPGWSPEALSGEAAEPDSRRAWLRGQLVGVLTTCRILAGEQIDYADEVEACYGVRPRRVPEEVIAAAHRDLDEVVPGDGPLAERLLAWRTALVVPPELLERTVLSIAEDLRERTARMFGLPEGEEVDFEIVTNKPWSGFNYYLGGLRSRVAINVDLPVLSYRLAPLVAHEAYPGHHTEHSRKEIGLVRRRRWFEESIFLVGTPQCLLAEGLADLGIEAVVGPNHDVVVAEQLRPLGISYDPDSVAAVRQASEALYAARANAAFRLYEDHADPETVVDEVARDELVDRPRAEKAVEFLLDPTWRSYISCYIEGLPLCRRYVAGRPERFTRLISEQCLPADLLAG